MKGLDAMSSPWQAQGMAMPFLQDGCRMTQRFFVAWLVFGPLVGLADCPSWPTKDRFVEKGAEVIDARLGLTWKRCSEGQRWHEGICEGRASVFTQQVALSLAQAANKEPSPTPWRLPNVKELASLADRGCRKPAIDSSAFPATPSNWYWSSSPYVGYSDYAWAVVFAYGSIGNGYRGYKGHVRLVRDSD